jgi:hypothetical protein
MKAELKVSDSQVRRVGSGSEGDMKRLGERIRQYEKMVESYEIKQQQLYD